MVLTSEKYLFEKTFMFLAKTKFTASTISKFLQTENLNVPIRYMYQSSPDTIDYKPEQRDFTKFFHAFGHSGHKSTNQLLECWIENKDFPSLTIVGNDVAGLQEKVLLSNSKNVLIKSMQNIDDFQHLSSINSIHICPSSKEGFGHYINDARSKGALVITTDYPPMNEFVQDGVSGILIENTHVKDGDNLLFSDSIKAFVSPQNICDGVKRVLHMTVSDRERLGNRAREKYEQERLLMIEKLLQLKIEALEHLFDKSINQITLEYTRT
jgi:glycosyltransferase involved in cell wall biosynthesis